MKPRPMCSICPWRNQKLKWKQPVFEQIAKDVAAGKYMPHACHSLSYDMIPASEGAECQGHKRHLIKVGLLNKDGTKCD